MLSDNDAMKLYMQNISQFPLLNTSDEARLAALIAKGDQDAKTELISCNLRLVVKIAHDFRGYGLPLLDLISEGNIGLTRAVEKFDPTKGAKLSSYAAWWIKQAMRRALSNQTKIIRIPVQSAAKISKIQAAIVKLTAKLGREPTHKEISLEVNLTERTVAGLPVGKTTTISLNDPIQQGEEGEFRDIIADEKTATPDEILQEVETLQHLAMLISKLEERERDILTMRFGLNGERPKTLEEVSMSIGRTRERVRQIQNQALTKLKSQLEEKSLTHPHLLDEENDTEESDAPSVERRAMAEVAGASGS